jgi:membrane peptidoglycan carboxypeptidase
VSCVRGALYGSLPSTGDAVARLERILRAHGARFAAVPAGARVARAIVVVEDQRFFDHGPAAHPGSDPGGSTIAQQLAKTLRATPARCLGACRRSSWRSSSSTTSP